MCARGLSARWNMGKLRAEIVDVSHPAQLALPHFRTADLI